MARANRITADETRRLHSLTLKLGVLSVIAIYQQLPHSLDNLLDQQQIVMATTSHPAKRLSRVAAGEIFSKAPTLRNQRTIPGQP